MVEAAARQIKVTAFIQAITLKKHEALTVFNCVNTCVKVLLLQLSQLDGETQLEGEVLGKEVNLSFIVSAITVNVICL